MKTFLSEIILGICIAVLAILLLNPYWMPMGVVLAILICFIILVGGFAVFIWKEKGGDERDALIRYVAARCAYLASALILAVGIVYQTLMHQKIDTWLVVAFIVMVLAKILGSVYGKNKY
jgi:Kef-type K+ transport system membrane component KefB